MEFKDLLNQFLATPSQDIDWDLYYKEDTLTDDQIAQLTAAFNTRLAVQNGATNAP